MEKSLLPVVTVFWAQFASHIFAPSFLFGAVFFLRFLVGVFFSFAFFFGGWVGGIDFDIIPCAFAKQESMEPKKTPPPKKGGWDFNHQPKNLPSPQMDGLAVSRNGPYM